MCLIFGKKKYPNAVNSGNFLDENCFVWQLNPNRKCPFLMPIIIADDILLS